jgi:hypothetical protein
MVGPVGTERSRRDEPATLWATFVESTGTQYAEEDMEKWADYVITRVRFNAAGTHIDEVEAANDSEGGIGTKRNEKRATVIANLKARKTYVTAPPSTTVTGNVTKGAPVGIVVVNGTEWIRTDANRTARDNLDNLPTY